jgi:hypothetical protein
MLCASQYANIYKQLELGVRYFDIRFCYKEDEKTFRICHATFGPTIHEIMGQFRDYLNKAGHEKEVILLHVRNADIPLKNRWETMRGDLAQQFKNDFETPIRNHIYKNGDQKWTTTDTLENIVPNGSMLIINQWTPNKEGYRSNKEVLDLYWPEDDSVQDIKSVLVEKHKTQFSKNIP